MSLIYDVTSTLTQTALDAFCQKYHITDTVHPKLPGPNQSIHDIPAGKIGVYIRFFDFAYFRIPLSRFLVDVLEYFVSTCRSFSSLLLLSLFLVDASVFPFSIPWYTKKTLVRDPYPTAAKFSAKACDFLATHPAPFRKFSKPFLYVVGLSRYYELDDNVYPTFLTDAEDEMDMFAFIRHAEPTKVRIGERQIEEGKVPLLDSTKGRVIPLVGVDDHDGQNDNIENLNEGSGDVDQENHSDERDRAGQDEAKRRVVGASGPDHPLKKLREDHGTSGDAGVSTGGKTLAAIRDLFERSTLNVEVGVKAATTVPFVTSSVTHTPECEGDGNTDFVSRTNLGTQHPFERFVISLDSSHHSSTNAADAEVTSIVKSPVLPPPLMTAAVTTTIVAGTSSALVIGAGAKPVSQVHPCIFVDSASIGTTGLDVVGPSDLAGTELSADTFYVSQEMDSKTLQVEATKAIRLRGQVSVVEDAEAAQVSELNSLKEQNIALEEERTTLEGQVMMLESAAATKDNELASLNAQTAKLTHDLSSLQLSCDELSIKADSLESQRDNLADQVSSLETTCFGLRDQVSGYEVFKEQCEAIQDAQVNELSDRVAGLDSELMDVALHLDDEFYPRFLTTIAGRQWIISHGFRLAVMKCLQSSETLLLWGQLLLELQKDASIADIINYLCLEGPSSKTLEIIRLQPSYKQLLLPIHRKEDNVVVGETSLSNSLNVVHDRVQNLKEGAMSYRTSISNAIGTLVDPLSLENLVGEASASKVPAIAAATTALSSSVAAASASFILPILVVDYDVSAGGIQGGVPYSPKIVFEKETLETTPERPTTD
ncbi:hypothetical protein Tco_0401845 [Tanacetum coccineum]